MIKARSKLQLKLFLTGVSCWLIGIFAFTVWNEDEKLVLNVTHSLPGFVYLRTEGAIERGDIVSACAPPVAAKIGRILHNMVINEYSGVCPQQTNPLLKIVAAKAGDYVEADGINEIKINGKSFKGSAPHPNAVIPAFIFKGRIPKGRFLLLTHHYDGFDGRYFGLSHQIELRYKYRRLF